MNEVETGGGAVTGTATTGGIAGTGAPAPPASTPKTDREYLILESKQQGVWTEKEKVTAPDNDAALAAITEPDKQAKYQAIAMRNWSPKSPNVETVTTVTWQ